MHKIGYGKKRPEVTCTSNRLDKQWRLVAKKLGYTKKFELGLIVW